MTSWAMDYLVKSAMEKNAKRWFWRLAGLPEARRTAAIQQIERTTGMPIKYWGDLRNVGVSGRDQRAFGHEKEMYDAANKRYERLAAAKGITDRHQAYALQAKFPQLRALAESVPKLNATRNWSVGGRQFQIRRPEEYLPDQEWVQKIGPPIKLEDLPVNPRRYVYRGFHTDDLIEGQPSYGETAIFSSGYPHVAEHHSRGGGVLLQARTPKGAVFTPHLADVDKAKSLRAWQLVQKMNDPRWRHWKRMHPLTKEVLPYYETVMDRFSPLEDTLRAFRVVSRPEFPHTLREVGKKTILQPVKPGLSDVGKRMSLAADAWATPITSKLPEGFRP